MPAKATAQHDVERTHARQPGTISKAEIESTYKISRRIEAEERALECASIVFTSTAQEIDEQWGLYDGCALSPSVLMLTEQERPSRQLARSTMAPILSKPPDVLQCGVTWSSLQTQHR